MPIKSFISGFGGARHEITEVCMINAEISGLPFNISVHPVEEIGIMDGKEIGIIVGATTMEEWEIIPIPKTKDLDLSGLEKREFVEL